VFQVLDVATALFGNEEIYKAQNRFLDLSHGQLINMFAKYNTDEELIRDKDAVPFNDILTQISRKFLNTCPSPLLFATFFVNAKEELKDDSSAVLNASK